MLLVFSSTACIREYEDPNIIKDPIEPSKSEDTVCIQGVVYDQVTKQAVSNAKVNLVWSYYGFSSKPYGVLKTTNTNTDGSYEILWDKKLDADNIDLESFPWSFYLLADHSGYIGSNFPALAHYYNVNDSTKIKIDFELFHSTQLKFRVVNDTIDNQIDTAHIYISQHGVWPTDYVATGTLPHFYYYCRGKDFDQIYEYSNLWANTTYYCFFYLGSNINPFTETKKIEFSLKPDTVTEISITF